MDSLITPEFIAQIKAQGMFYAGELDCSEGLEPQSQDKNYLDGFAKQYEVEQIEGANHE